MGLPRHDDFVHKRSGWMPHFEKFYQFGDERQAAVIETLPVACPAFLGVQAFAMSAGR
jgi:hypothetical protein